MPVFKHIPADSALRNHLPDRRQSLTRVQLRDFHLDIGFRLLPLQRVFSGRMVHLSPLSHVRLSILYQKFNTKSKGKQHNY